LGILILTLIRAEFYAESTWRNSKSKVAEKVLSFQRKSTEITLCPYRLTFSIQTELNCTMSHNCYQLDFGEKAHY